MVEGCYRRSSLNRPAKLNAFTDAMVMRLADVLHEFDMDEQADVAVVRGEGRAFCSGAYAPKRALYAVRKSPVSPPPTI